MRYSPEVITNNNKPDEGPKRDAEDLTEVTNMVNSRHSLNGYVTTEQTTTTFNGEIYPNLYNNGHSNNVFLSDNGHIKLSHQDLSSDGDRTAL